MRNDSVSNCYMLLLICNHTMFAHYLLTDKNVTVVILCALHGDKNTEPLNNGRMRIGTSFLSYKR